MVEEIGNHVVTICGVGEYKKEIRFTIEPNIEYNQVLSENHYNATFTNDNGFRVFVRIPKQNV